MDHLYALIDSTLKELIEAPPYPETILKEGAAYALLSPGKRIRPLLVLATGEVLGAPLPSLLIPACALEMVHAYSLVHDDLPAMDDDDYRRGKPTLHKVIGEGPAILVGDFLLTYAFEVLATAPSLTIAQRLSLITTLAKAAGATGMASGQMLDITSAQAPLKTLTDSLKTGALFSCALTFATIIHPAPHLLATLNSLGHTLGLLFQACDDLLDGDSTCSLEHALTLSSQAHSLLSSLPHPTLFHHILTTITAPLQAIPIK